MVIKMSNQIEAKVKSLYKALNLLDHFTISPYEYGISGLAKTTGLPKSSVHNILSTFVQYGLVNYDQTTKRYRLGYKTIELSNSFNNANSFIKIMHPYLERMSALSQENVYLGMIIDCFVVYLDVVYPQSSTMGGNIIGTKAPLYCTGIGKAMLSQADEEIRQRVLTEPMEKYTVNTITDKNRLLSELDIIKKNGVAVDDMEHEFGVKCVAVPLMGQNGALVGGMSVSGPSLRFSQVKIEQYTVYLKDIASEVKKYL